MEAKILKYGQFEATNGVDVILATYARGTKQADGKMHPTWTLEMGKKSFIIEGNKEEALQKAKELLELPMSSPLTEKEATAMLEEDGSIHGIVAVPVSSILNHHTDEFLNDLGALRIGFNNKSLFNVLAGHFGDNRLKARGLKLRNRGGFGFAVNIGYLFCGLSLTYIQGD